MEQRVLSLPWRIDAPSVRARETVKMARSAVEVLESDELNKAHKEKKNK